MYSGPRESFHDQALARPRWARHTNKGILYLFYLCGWAKWLKASPLDQPLAASPPPHKYRNLYNLLLFFFNIVGGRFLSLFSVRPPTIKKNIKDKELCVRPRSRRWALELRSLDQWSGTTCTHKFLLFLHFYLCNGPQYHKYNKEIGTYLWPIQRNRSERKGIDDHLAAKSVDS